MDELGIATVLLPTGDIGRHGTLDPYDFEHVAARWEEVEKLAGRWPGRFAALALIDPRARDARRAGHARAPRRPVGRRLLPPHAQLRPAPRPRRLLPVLRGVRRRRRAGADAGGNVGRADGERVRPPDHASTAPRSTSATPSSCCRTSGVPWVDEADRARAEVPERVPGHRRAATSALAAGGAAVPARPRPDQGAVRQQLPDRRSPSRARPGRRARAEAGDRAGVARRHRASGVHPPRGRSRP